MAYGTTLLGNIPAAGSVTTPAKKIAPDLTSSLTPRFIGNGPVWLREIPGFGGVIAADGWSPIKHFLGSAIYRTGLLGPAAAPVAAPTGARATATFTGTGGTPPQNNDFFVVGSGSGLGIYFKTALITDSAAAGYQLLQVLVVAADTATTITNLRALVNNEAGQNTKYHNGLLALGFPVYTLADVLDIEISAVTATTATFRALTYGTAGNNYYAQEMLDAGGTWTIGTANRFAGGGDGSGSAPGPGLLSWAFSFLRNADGGESAVGEVDTEDLATAMNVVLGTMTQSADDSTIDFVRLYRTLVEQGLLFRVSEVKRGSVPDDQITDSSTDATIATRDAIPYDETLRRPYSSGHVPRYRYVVPHLGHLFGAGRILRSKYAVGTAAVVQDALTVTLSAAAVVTHDMEGMTFRVADHNVEYLITRAVPATRVLHLNKAYKGSNDATASYALEDRTNPAEVGMSTFGDPNSWPPGLAFEGVSTQSEIGCTGLASIWEALIILTPDGVWRLSGVSIESFQLRKALDGSGCIAGHSVVAAGGALYWLGAEGIWRWDGQGEPELISRPRPFQGAILGCQRTIDRINRDCADLVVGRYDKETKSVRWLVPLDDAFIPGHRLVYDTETGAWSTDRADDMTTEANVVTRSGATQAFGIDHQGNLWQLETSNSDGAYEFEPVQTITGTPTTRAITVTGGSLPSSGDGLLGVPFVVVTAAGNIYRGKVASNTGNSIVAVRALPAAPASGDKIIFGAIHLRLLSGRFDGGVADRSKMMSDLDVAFVPGADGYLYLATAANQDDLAVPTVGEAYADLTEADGFARFSPGARGYALQFELFALEPGCDIEVAQVAFAQRVAADRLRAPA